MVKKFKCVRKEKEDKVNAEGKMKFAVDVQRARKETSVLEEKIQTTKASREEILEEEYLEFAIGEMEVFGTCSTHALGQYKLMTFKEVQDFIKKYFQKGIFKGI